MTLQLIQSLEDKLIHSNNCGSQSVLFTEMMHATSEWIDKESSAKRIHVSPFKLDIDKEVDLVAYHITCGYSIQKAQLQKMEIKLVGNAETMCIEILLKEH